MVGGGDFGSRLLHITLGSLWRGNFVGRWSSSEEVIRGNLPVNSNLVKCHYMLDLDAGGGGDLYGGFLRGGDIYTYKYTK